MLSLIHIYDAVHIHHGNLHTLTDLFTGNAHIVLAVVLVFTYQGFKYVGVAGKQISQGMEIPMMYMYGIMPVCGIILSLIHILIFSVTISSTRRWNMRSLR